jgi:hypothetical protein
MDKKDSVHRKVGMPCECNSDLEYYALFPSHRILMIDALFKHPYIRKMHLYLLSQ